MSWNVTSISEAPTQALAPEAQQSGVADQPAVVPQVVAPTVPAAPTQAASTPASSPKSRRALWIGLGVVAVIVVAAIALMAVNRNRSTPVPVAQPPAQPVSSAPQPPLDQPPPDVAPLEAQFAHANEFVSQSKLDQADTEFKQVAEKAENLLESNPNLPSTQRAQLHSLAGQSWLAIDQPNRAPPHFQALVEMAPKAAEPLVGVAATHLLQDRLDQANDALDRAIRLNPDLSSAHLLKACLLLKQNERVLALHELRQAGGPEALLKTQPWMQPVLRRIECMPDRFK